MSGPPRRVRVVLRDVEARSPSRADGADRNAGMVRLMKSCARAAARDHHTVSQIYFSSRHFLPNSLSVLSVDMKRARSWRHLRTAERWRITLGFSVLSVPLRLGRAKVSPPASFARFLWRGQRIAWSSAASGSGSYLLCPASSILFKSSAASRSPRLPPNGSRSAASRSRTHIGGVCQACKLRLRDWQCEAQKARLAAIPGDPFRHSVDLPALSGVRWQYATVGFARRAGSALVLHRFH